MSKNGKPRKKRILRKILLFLVLLLILGGVGLYAYLSLKVEYTVTIPANTTAEFIAPDGTKRTLRVGENRITL